MVGKGGGVLPYMDHIGGLYSPKGCDFAAILVINRASIGYGFCTLVLIWVCFKEEATFPTFLRRRATKALHILSMTI